MPEEPETTEPEASSSSKGWFSGISSATVIKIVIVLAITGCLVPVIQLVISMFKAISKDPLSNAVGAAGSKFAAYLDNCSKDKKGVGTTIFCTLMSSTALLLLILYMFPGLRACLAKGTQDIYARLTGKSMPEVLKEQVKEVRPAIDKITSSQQYKDALENAKDDTERAAITKAVFDIEGAVTMGFKVREAEKAAIATKQKEANEAMKTEGTLVHGSIDKLPDGDLKNELRDAAKKAYPDAG